MAQVKEGDTISLHYTLTLDDGMVVDSSEGSDPLQFTVGSGDIIEGFDEAVRGMEEGETREFTVAPEQAYGDYREEMVLVLSSSLFPADSAPVVGSGVEIPLPSGGSHLFRIIEVSEEEVTLDGNHLLSGETLHFRVQLLGIGGEAVSV